MSKFLRISCAQTKFCEAWTPVNGYDYLAGRVSSALIPEISKLLQQNDIWLFTFNINNFIIILVFLLFIVLIFLKNLVQHV